MKITCPTIVALCEPNPALALPVLQLLGLQEYCKGGRTHPPSPRRDADVMAKLDAQLLSLSVRGYERLIAYVLEGCGYEDVQVLRDHERARCSHKGRTGHGGADLRAKLRAEFSESQVLVQAKQYARPVSRRFVDELRGALLRNRTSHGMLFTTSTFSPAAREAARQDHLAPVYLVDGLHLKTLLLAHRLGVKRNRRGRLVMRRRFFKRLDLALAPLPTTKGT